MTSLVVKLDPTLDQRVKTFETYWTPSRPDPPRVVPVVAQRGLL